MPADKDTSEYKKSSEIIERELSGNRFFELGNRTTEKNNIFMGEYTGGFISADDGVLTLGVALKKNAKFMYKPKTVINLAFNEDFKLYLVEAKVLNTRGPNAEDMGKLGELFRNRLKSLEKVIGPLAFIIVEVCVLGKPVQHQRRRYPRSNVSWNVYFKIMQPDAELSAKQEEWIESGLIEYDRGFFKTKTVDVSAGGFKSIVKVEVPQGTQLESIMEIMMGEVKAISKIISRVVGCEPNLENPDLYNMRVQFLSVSDALKAAL